MSTQKKEIVLTFPEKLDLLKNGLLAQKELLQKVSELYSDAIMDGGVIYIYMLTATPGCRLKKLRFVWGL